MLRYTSEPVEANARIDSIEEAINKDDEGNVGRKARG